MNTVSFIVKSIADEFAACLPRDLYGVEVVRGDDGVICVKYWRI